MKEEVEKYATLIMSMTLDFQLGKIDERHYSNTLLVIAQQLNELINVPPDKKQ